MADMQDLIARLEKAEGPSRELDARIDNFLAGGTDADLAYILEDIERVAPPPEFTASLDCALTLVPDGLGFEVSRSNSGNCAHARVTDNWWPDITNGFFAHQVATPAIALCIAALRARSA